MLQPPPLLVVLLHPLRMKNFSEHRFDLPSATEPQLKFEQARVLGCEAAKHLSGGCDLLGAPFRATADSLRYRLQENGPASAWPTSLLLRSLLLQTPDAADVRPDTCKTPSWAGPFTPWLAGLRATAMMGPPKNGGGHGPQRTIFAAILARCEWNGFTAPRGTLFWATRAFSRGKGEAASGGPGRAGAVSARADVEGNSWRMTVTSAALAGSRVRPGLDRCRDRF